MRGARLRGLALACTALMAFGCADQGSPGSGDGATGGTAAEDREGMSGEELAGIDPENVNMALDWTTSRISAESQEGETPARTVTSVRLSTLPGSDRMIVEFAEDAPLPSHVVESFIRPVERCGTTDSIRSQGPGLLRISFPEASADSTVAAPDLSASALANVSSVQLGCLEESTVEWVLDVRDATAYRVLHLSNPTRLVVDVRHAVAAGGADGSPDTESETNGGGSNP